MSLTPANTLISLQDGLLAPVNLSVGDIGLYTPGNDLVFRLQTTKYIQRAEFTLLAPRYPGLHQLTYSWVPGQYNGWQITFPASALVSDASVIAGVAIVVTVTDSNGSVTGTNFLESKASGGGSSGVGTFIAFTSTDLLAGDEVTSADSGIDAGRIQKATTTAMINNVGVWGVALLPALANTLTLYAGIGATVAGSLVGITADGVEAYAILVQATGGTIRKTSPEPGDYVLGEIDSAGNVHIAPWRSDTSAIVIGSPGYDCIADGDSAHDCWAAIQRAFDDSLTGSVPNPSTMRQVVLPRGLFYLSKPVHMKYTGNTFRGEGMFSSVLHAPGYCGPGLLISNLLVPMQTVTDAPFPTTPPGGPNGIHMESHADLTNDRFLDFGEYGNGCNVNGFAGFTIRCRIRVSSTGTGDGIVFASSGHRFLSDPGGLTGGACAFALFVNPTNRGLTWRVNVSTTGSVNAAFAIGGGDVGIPLDQWFWIEAFVGVGVNGGEMGVFRENLATGQMEKLVFLPAVGTVVQQDWETQQLGNGFSDIFGEGKAYDVMKGDICHLDFSNVRRHDFGALANFTAAFASYGNNRPNADGATCLYNAFQTYQGVFVGGLTAANSGSNNLAPAWYPVTSRAPTEGVVDAKVSELAISCPHGSAITAYTFVKGTISRIYGSSKTGILMRNNCFTSRIEDCDFRAGLDARYGIMMGAAAYETSVTDCQLTGFKYGLIAHTASVITGGYYIDNTQFGVLVFDASNFSMVGVSISDEGGGYINPLNSVGLIRCALVNMTGCVLLNVTGAGRCVTSENAGYFFQRTDITLDGTALASHGAFTSPVVAPANYQFKIVNTDGFVTSVSSDTFQFTLANPAVVPGVPLPAIDPASSTNVEWDLRPTAVFGHFALAMADANQTVTNDQWLRGNLDCTGALTANRTVTVPINKTPTKLVTNSTTGGFSILIKAAGGAVTHTIPNGQTWQLSSNGTELRHIQ